MARRPERGPVRARAERQGAGGEFDRAAERARNLDATLEAARAEVHTNLDTIRTGSPEAAAEVLNRLHQNASNNGPAEAVNDNRSASGGGGGHDAHGGGGHHGGGAGKWAGRAFLFFGVIFAAIGGIMKGAASVSEKGGGQKAHKPANDNAAKGGGGGTHH